MHPMIKVEGLSKAYQLGTKKDTPDTLVKALKNAAMLPFNNLARLRKLDTNRLGQSHATDDSPPDILWALKNNNFEVQEGDVVGIIGRNGAGKSTLLKVLSRITSPTKGKATIRGRVSSLLEVGTGFHPDLTGRENIYMNGTILGMTRHEIKRKFDDIVEFSGVQKFLDTPTKRYSSGMQVRLAFAVAAHLNPEILIVDEVLAVGDIEFQRKCLGQMQQISESGRTVLFVSHNVSLIKQLCKSGIVLKNGQIAYQGPIDRALESYGCVQAANTWLNPDTSKSELDISRISICGERENELDIIYCGQQISVAIDFSTTIDADQLHCMIEFHDEIGQKLFTIGTPLSKQIRRSKLASRIIGTVPSLDLAPGRYFLNVRLGTLANNISERTIEEAVAFNVEASDFYGGIKAPAKQRGPLLMRSDWKITDC